MLWQNWVLAKGSVAAGGIVAKRVSMGLLAMGFVLVALAAFQLARHWQAREPLYSRVAPAEGCDLRVAPCRQSVAGGVVEFSIVPRVIPLMRPLQIAAGVDGLDVRGVAVEIRGLNMDMGLNRTLLTQSVAGRWDGETILPVCSQRRMHWEAAVLLDAVQGRFEVPFLFHTVRP
jgi:hypothetical protein